MIKAPRFLSAVIYHHTVDTAAEKSWSKLLNGERIDQAETEKYDAIVTTDLNLKYQQNLSGRKMFHSAR